MTLLISCMLFELCFLFHQTLSTSMGSKSRQSKVEELGGILDKMRVQSKTIESNLGNKGDCIKHETSPVLSKNPATHLDA